MQQSLFLSLEKPSCNISFCRLEIIKELSRQYELDSKAKNIFVI